MEPNPYQSPQNAGSKPPKSFSLVRVIVLLVAVIASVYALGLLHVICSRVFLPNS
jgi:hypothetical protein